jgi:hypothetical protein
MPRRYLTIGVVLGVVGVLYLCAFEWMYVRRGPAANMFYFVYSENSARDTFCFRAFYPAYWVQQRFLSGQKHNDDREAVSPLSP